MHAQPDPHRTDRVGSSPPLSVPDRALRIPLPLLLLALQLPLILNPGYFSHDELQWWSRADVPSWTDLPWIAWLDPTPLQYRPLTFNLWLVLAHAFAATPRLMHFVFVALGTTNAVLLARTLAGANVPSRTCYAAAIVFALSPFAVYVHGWTATLADLLVLLFALLAARAIQRAPATASMSTIVFRAIGVALLVALALLCKESAVVLPALLVLAAYGQPSSRPARFAVAASAAVVIAYLVLRFPILANSAATDPAYAWSLRNIEPRLVEYLLYPFMPPLFEIGPLWKVSLARWLAALVCANLYIYALVPRSRRWPAVWLAAYTVALAPVLVLSTAYNQYAYLASAIPVAIAASAWPALGRPQRAILVILAAIVVAHGAAVMSRIVSAGIVENNLHADLLAAVQREPDTPIVVSPADPRDAWLLQRLLHDVERYRGVSLLNVHPAAENGPSIPGARRFQMNRFGHLSPAAGS